MTAYLIEVFGGVEPELCGPFENAEKRDDAAAEWFREYGIYSPHSLFALDVEGDGKPEVWAYSAAFADEACGALEDDCG